MKYSHSFLLRSSSLALVLGLLASIGCAPSENLAEAQSGTRLKVVTTTSMIADLAGRIAGDHAEVVGLMGTGIDPHLYKASQGDIHLIAEADLVLYNGLHLEGKMTDILVKMARSRPVVAITENLGDDSLREPPEFLGQYDPHVWFDVSIWAQTAPVVRDALIEIDPANAAEFAARCAQVVEQLVELDAWVEAQIAELPEEARVLVTAHDAFGYFGVRYGMEVIGLQGISTLAEAGLRDVERVVDLVVEREIPAVFIESSVPVKSIEAVQAASAARGWPVAIGGQLYSDSMGAPGTEEGNYFGMVRANVETIVNALGDAGGESRGDDE